MAEKNDNGFLQKHAAVNISQTVSSNEPISVEDYEISTQNNENE